MRMFGSATPASAYPSGGKVPLPLAIVLSACLSAGAPALAQDRPTAPQPPATLHFRQMSDASAAVALADNEFIAADDETNVLRVYRLNAAPAPVASYDLTSFLAVDPKHPETDLEGAARSGDRVYWISSHGRDKDGDLRPSRYRFFATQVRLDGTQWRIEPAGRPCRRLLEAILEQPWADELHLPQAARLANDNLLTRKEREQLAPKRQGVNIEALAFGPDGRTLYIGFRNPRPVHPRLHRPCALVVPLKNPAALVETAAPPLFQRPLLWDLDGLGVRSMEYSPPHQTVFIVAGPSDETRRFALYRWSGNEQEQPTLVRPLENPDHFTPESVVPFAGSPLLLLLSDDGTLPIPVAGPDECQPGQINADGTCPNKCLLDIQRRQFRAMWLQP